MEVLDIAITNCNVKRRNFSAIKFLKKIRYLSGNTERYFATYSIAMLGNQELKCSAILDSISDIGNKKFCQLRDWPAILSECMASKSYQIAIYDFHIVKR